MQFFQRTISAWRTGNLRILSPKNILSVAVLVAALMFGRYFAHRGLQQTSRSADSHADLEEDSVQETSGRKPRTPGSLAQTLEGHGTDLEQQFHFMSNGFEFPERLEVNLLLSTSVRGDLAFSVNQPFIRVNISFTRDKLAVPVNPQGLGDLADYYDPYRKDWPIDYTLADDLKEQLKKALEFNPRDMVYYAERRSRRWTLLPKGSPGHYPMFITQPKRGPDKPFYVSYFMQEGEGPITLHFEGLELQSEEVSQVWVKSFQNHEILKPAWMKLSEQQARGLVLQSSLTNCRKEFYPACFDATIVGVQENFNQESGGPWNTMRVVLLHGGLLMDPSIPSPELKNEENVPTEEGGELSKGEAQDRVFSTAMLVPYGRGREFFDQLMVGPNGEYRKFVVVSGGYGVDERLPEKYFSIHYKDLAYWLGYKIAENWRTFRHLGYTHLVSASLGPESLGHSVTYRVASWDLDTARGFCTRLHELGYLDDTVHRCPALHFKDVNTVRTSAGDMWEVRYGQSILFDVKTHDWSNSMKEVALLTMASTGGLTLLGSGGPTVAKNLVKFAMLPKSDSKAYVVCGAHGSFSSSGASGVHLNDKSAKAAIKDVVDMEGLPQSVKDPAIDLLKKLGDHKLSEVNLADLGLADLSDRVLKLHVNGSMTPMSDYKTMNERGKADICEGFGLIDPATDQATISEDIQHYANQAVRKILDSEVKKSRAAKKVGASWKAKVSSSTATKEAQVMPAKETRWGQALSATENKENNVLPTKEIQETTVVPTEETQEAMGLPGKLPPSMKQAKNQTGGSLKVNVTMNVQLHSQPEGNYSAKLQ